MSDTLGRRGLWAAVLADVQDFDGKRGSLFCMADIRVLHPTLDCRMRRGSRRTVKGETAWRKAEGWKLNDDHVAG